MDTGLTMSYLLENMRTRHPASIRICSLLHKPSRTKNGCPSTTSASPSRICLWSGMGSTTSSATATYLDRRSVALRRSLLAHSARVSDETKLRRRRGNLLTWQQDSHVETKRVRRTLLSQCGLWTRSRRGHATYLPGAAKKSAFDSTIGPGDHPTIPGEVSSADIHDPAQELIGKIIGERYEIQRLLGQGGMGVVYQARHISLEKLLAVKLLLIAQNEEYQRRFLQEAQLASQINHPNTVFLSDFGVLPDGRSYIVMELCAVRRWLR